MGLLQITRLAGEQFYSILPQSFEVDMRKMPWKARSLLFVLGLTLGGTGCVQRTLTVRTDPPGALVYLNDQEIGRTPVTRNFTWYGVYDLEIRLEGYESIKSTAPVIAPWWQWVPFDFFAEAFMVTDKQELFYTLRPPSARNEEPELIVKRGEQLRGELEASHLPPATKPAKHPAANHPHTKPATAPTTAR